MSKPLINRCFIHIVAVMFLALGSSIAFANDFQAFAESLEGRGWQVQKDASGSLLLFPTAGQHATGDSRITDQNTEQTEPTNNPLPSPNRVPTWI